MSRVFIVSETYRNRDGARQPTWDADKAGAYGELQFLTPGNLPPYEVQSAAWIIREKLRDFCDDDCLLPNGPSTFIALAGAFAAAANHGRVRFLLWREPRNREPFYQAVPSNMWEGEKEMEQAS